MFKRVLSVLACLVVAASVYGGGTENKLNQSAGYARFPAKNTETEKPDAIFFNPAGTALMEDGLYVSFGNQFIYKKYEEKVGGKTFDTDEPSLIFPDAEIVWKKGDTALFSGFTMFSGGGGLDWKGGNAFTYSTLEKLGAGMGYPQLKELGLDMECFSVVYGNMTGIAHSFLDDKLSVGVAGKILYGYQTSEINLDNAPTGMLAAALGTDSTLAETKATGWGFGAVFSVDYKPIPELTFAATYHTQSVVSYEYDKADGTGAQLLGASKGDTFEYNLPAYLSIGASWRPIDPLLVAIGGNWYFNNQADYDYDDAWEINFAAEYAFNKYLAASLGGFYTNIGSNSSEGGQTPINPILDSMTYCGGVEITFNEMISLDVGAFYTQYFEEDWKDVTINKWIWEVAVGPTFKF